MDAAAAAAVDELIASRNQKLLLTGMFASLYQIAEGVRAKGFSGQGPSELVLGPLVEWYSCEAPKLLDDYREIMRN